MSKSTEEIIKLIKDLHDDPVLDKEIQRLLSSITDAVGSAVGSISDNVLSSLEQSMSVLDNSELSESHKDAFKMVADRYLIQQLMKATGILSQMMGFGNINTDDNTNYIAMQINSTGDKVKVIRPILNVEMKEMTIEEAEQLPSLSPSIDELRELGSKFKPTVSSVNTKIH
jgi:hypothetical protein